MTTTNKTGLAVALQKTAVKPASLLLEPVADNDHIIKAWRNYQELKKGLLNETDYQLIQGKQYIKKSGWRKIQTAFGISDELIKEDRKDYAQFFVYEITVKLISQNERYAYGVGSCSSNERTFAHPEHDVRSTAHTRAKNRAISDLIGGGEVSAEEIVSTPSSKESSSSYYEVKQKDQEYEKPIDTKANDDGMMTDKQRNLLVSLISQKILDEDEREEQLQSIESYSKSDASEAIGELLKQ